VELFFRRTSFKPKVDLLGCIPECSSQARKTPDAIAVHFPSGTTHLRDSTSAPTSWRTISENSGAGGNPRRTVLERLEDGRFNLGSVKSRRRLCSHRPWRIRRSAWAYAHDAQPPVLITEESCDTSCQRHSSKVVVWIAIGQPSPPSPRILRQPSHQG